MVAKKHVRRLVILQSFHTRARARVVDQVHHPLSFVFIVLSWSWLSCAKFRRSRRRVFSPSPPLEARGIGLCRFLEASLEKLPSHFPGLGLVESSGWWSGNVRTHVADWEGGRDMS